MKKLDLPEGHIQRAEALWDEVCRTGLPEERELAIWAAATVLLVENPPYADVDSATAASIAGKFRVGISAMLSAYENISQALELKTSQSWFRYDPHCVRPDLSADQLARLTKPMRLPSGGICLPSQGLDILLAPRNWCEMWLKGNRERWRLAFELLVLANFIEAIVLHESVVVVDHCIEDSGIGPEETPVDLRRHRRYLRSQHPATERILDSFNAAVPYSLVKDELDTEVHFWALMQAREKLDQAREKPDGIMSIEGFAAQLAGEPSAASGALLEFCLGSHLALLTAYVTGMPFSAGPGVEHFVDFEFGNRRPQPARQALRELEKQRAIAGAEANDTIGGDLFDVNIPMIFAAVLREASDASDIINIAAQMRNTREAKWLREWSNDIKSSPTIERIAREFEEIRDLSAKLAKGLRIESQPMQIGLSSLFSVRTSFSFPLPQKLMEIFDQVGGRKHLLFLRRIAAACNPVASMAPDLERVFHVDGADLADKLKRFHRGEKHGEIRQPNDSHA